MWELTKRISLRILSVFLRWIRSQEPDLYTGSDQKVPAPTGSGSATLNLTYPGGKNEKEDVLALVELVNEGLA